MGRRAQRDRGEEVMRSRPQPTSIEEFDEAEVAIPANLRQRIELSAPNGDQP